MANAACKYCGKRTHPFTAHTVNCVVCDFTEFQDSWDYILEFTEESPYRKGFRVFNCQDEERHKKVREFAQTLPGTIERPVKPNISKEEAETLQKLF